MEIIFSSQFTSSWCSRLMKRQVSQVDHLVCLESIRLKAGTRVVEACTISSSLSALEGNVFIAAMAYSFQERDGDKCVTKENYVKKWR